MVGISMPLQGSGTARQRGFTVSHTVLMATPCTNTMMMMMFTTILAREQNSKGRLKDGRLYEGNERRWKGTGRGEDGSY